MPPTPRSRLLQSARTLLTESGVESLTLRAIARHAGVSHGAPLKHFPHRAALLSAIATQGFRELAARTGDELNALPPTAPPARHLRTGLHAYAEFALASPEMFQLMFRQDLLDPTDEELREAGTAAFTPLLTGVRNLQTTGWQREADPLLLAGALWSSVHGLAQLWSWGSLPYATTATSMDQIYDTLCQALGLNATDPA
ncbi:TetR/AcrR family transcriptional regulator [Streptomyces polyrhachis]|uniref:TetR/AcrR family transcriptional regulator n=1 Tax=Streptomyces polyrhachis TaxID=1282885 RepID=A0ABW2GKG7_9ACTN